MNHDVATKRWRWLFPRVWALVLFLGIGVPVGWQLSVIFGGNRDDEAVATLEGEGATVQRWSRPTPVVLFGGDDGSGDVQSVVFVNKDINDDKLDILPSLQRCHRVGFARCAFHDKSRITGLEAMSSLDTLLLKDCNITDDDLEVFLNMTRLKYLYLQGNPITDRGISTLGQITWLKALIIGRTEITSHGIASLRKLLPNTDIDIALQ